MIGPFTFHDRRSDAARPTPLEFYHKIRSRLDELGLPWEDDKLYPYVYNPERENSPTFMGKPLRTPDHTVTEHTGREIRERALHQINCYMNDVYVKLKEAFQALEAQLDIRASEYDIQPREWRESEDGTRWQQQSERLGATQVMLRETIEEMELTMKI